MQRATPILLVGLLMTACSSAEGDAPADPNPIDAYIASLPYLPVEATAVAEGTPSAPVAEGDYSCTTQNLKETRQYDRVVAYAANSDSMYPGAIIGADSVMTGLFTQVVLPRASETISVSLENLGGTKQAAVTSPSLSSYRDALSGILDAEITGSTPANLYSEIEEVHSENQLNMALGVQASWGLGVASLKASFDWSNHNVRSRYVVRYTQAYYTVDLDAPASPSALFAPDVTLADVQGKLDAQRPPVYVSSVTYGRLVLFTFESQYSAEEMSAALDFAYSGGVDVKGDVSVTYKDIISQSKITAFILGGDAGTAVQTIDSYDALKNFIKSGGNYSRQSPGAPIAYKLAYLKDNSPARMSFTTDYQVKDCVRVSQRVRVTLQSIAVDSAGGDAGSDLELYGLITAEGTDLQPLFNKDSSHYVQIHEGSVFGGGTPIGETVINVSPQAGQSIRLHAHLTDQDTLSGDDNIGDEVMVNLFETGWRKDVTMTLTGDGARVRVNFSLTPI
ncbi:MAG TPA: thiol-activated cytolysin family protein [Kofleriaceae bacterium]|jgi:thiol-activated cytolysin|nr:thiol-activated cytolysin family protein [Kofleriaceae bacterium]